MFRLCSLLGLLALANSEESSEELEAEKPTLLKVVGADSKRPKDGLELRVLQRHGRAPLPPEPQHLPSSEDEVMEEFSEIIVEYKTNFYVSSIQVRLPEKQQQLPHSVIDFDGYKFFTGPNNECKFQLGDKSLLPDNDTQVARDMAGSGEISNCAADNSDTSDVKPRRSSALLKFHPHPFEHNVSGWRYFSMMIRNAQSTPLRSSINGQEANTFQIVVNTPWETIAEMSFEALEIQQVWVCSYSPWFVTTPCTADCGGGFRTRVRRKLHANPEGYNPKLLKSCDENIEEHESCNTQDCDVDCQLSEWTPWANGECSRSCGNGIMVERRNVVMGPKGNGKKCPPWSAEGERVRVVPCNPDPCPASCTESSLDFEEMVKDSNSKLLVFKDVPQPGVRAIEEAEAAAADDQNDQNDQSEENEETQNETSTKESDEESQEAQEAQESEDQAGIGEGEDDSKVDEDATQSLLSTQETPAIQFGFSKSSCSEPCGGGRRLVLAPSEQKVSSGKEDKSCYTAFEEDCNTFACRPLMIQPATAWQFPVAGKWFMVDVEFVIEELAESLTLRAPPDFLLAADLPSRELCFALLLTFLARSFCFKPVIIVHGILDHASDMKDLASFITQAHPGTNITLIKLFEELDSFKPMWMQVSAISEKVREVMQEAKDGVHIIGFSQGGLTVRAILETMDDHNAESVISLSGPQMGQYGDTDYLKPYIPKLARKDLYLLFYTKYFQDTISLANYWNDPYHEDKNYEYNVFLPVVNNLNSSKFFNASVGAQFKENFLRIKNLILVGGPDDGVITPWQSSQFGFYDTSLTVVDMKNQQVYLEDTFGLRTLDERGSVHHYTFPGVNHTHWHGTEKVFVEAIEPWLT